MIRTRKQKRDIIKRAKSILGTYRHDGDYDSRGRVIDRKKYYFSAIKYILKYGSI